MGPSSSKTFPLTETAQVWNLVLVLGHTDGGWLDLIIASLLTLLGGSETGGVYGGVGIATRTPGLTESWRQELKRAQV